jgi:hypothetical protein
MPLYNVLRSLLNILVQIANKMGLHKILTITTLFDRKLSSLGGTNPRKARREEQERMAVARQRPGKYFTAATNKHTTVEEILEAEIYPRLASRLLTTNRYPAVSIEGITDRYNIFCGVLAS